MKTRTVTCSACKQTRTVVDGSVLRHRREHAHVTLRTLARRAGLSVSYLSDVELNRRNATDRVVSVYAKLEDR